MFFVSTKIPSTGEQRIVADPNSAAPAVTCRVAAVLRKVVSIKGVGPFGSALWNPLVSSPLDNVIIIPEQMFSEENHSVATKHKSVQGGHHY